MYLFWLRWVSVAVRGLSIGGLQALGRSLGSCGARA